MSEQGHLSDLGYEGQFGLERRGYNRMQVDESIAQLRLELRAHEDGRRDLEDRLSRALDETERLRLELSAERSSGRPAHEEISERIGQILKLADDEAKSQRARADDEITRLRADADAATSKLRADVTAETDKIRAEAQEQAERMLGAAQEESESTRQQAGDEAKRVVGEAAKQAETTLATAKSEARQQLDEATARATAIHDGAERRLNLLMARHTEAVRRLTEIRDVVTTLVAGEADRGSLEDEVARVVAGNRPPAGSPNGGQAPAGQAPAGQRGPSAGAPAAPASPAAVRGGSQPRPDQTGARHAQPGLSTAQRPNGMPGGTDDGSAAAAATE